MENLASKVNLFKLSPMDGSGIKELTLNGSRTVSVKSKRGNLVGRIFVEGYDTELPHDDVQRALRKLFSSCGEITDICIRRTEYNFSRCAIIYFMGEGAVDKALQLGGSDVGGWKAIVSPYPFPEGLGCDIVLFVTGYDTSLSKIDIESALHKHFSSCGEISEVIIFETVGAAQVCISGEDVDDKVRELDGSVMGGCKLLVRVTSGGIYTVHKRRRFARRNED